MLDLKKLNKEYLFLNTTVKTEGDSYRNDFEPLFEAIENYASELGGSFKWVNESLFIYHKDFSDIKDVAREKGASYEEFLYYTKEDLFHDDNEIEVSFGDDVYNIMNAEALKEKIEEIVTKELPSDYYYSEEEQALRAAKRLIEDAENKKRADSREKFLEFIAKLRISEAEFQEALSYYNA